jgi:hypothetical protein
MEAALLTQIFAYIYTHTHTHTHIHTYIHTYIHTHTHIYRCAPVSTDSVSAIYRGPPKNLKIKEINGS